MKLERTIAAHPEGFTLTASANGRTVGCAFLIEEEISATFWWPNSTASHDPYLLDLLINEGLRAVWAQLRLRLDAR